MANKFMDRLATGSGSGDDWANAYTSLQNVINNATSGDTIFCRNGETPTTAIDAYYSNNKSFTWIGCNSSGVEDNSFFVLDCANIVNWTASNVAILFYGTNTMRNFEVKNVPFGKTAIGAYGALTCVNCFVHDNGGWAFKFTNMSISLYFCDIWDNYSGINDSPCALAGMQYCDFRRNGFNATSVLSLVSSGCIIQTCLFARNIGKIALNDVSKIIGCTMDRNRGTLLSVETGILCLYATRITNGSGYGVYQANNTLLFEDGNFIHNNTSGAFYDVWDDCDHFTEGHTATQGNDGYLDPDNYDYRLSPEATNINIEYDIDGVNKHYFCSGFIPQLDRKIFGTKSKLYKPSGSWRINK